MQGGRAASGAAQPRTANRPAIASVTVIPPHEVTMTAALLGQGSFGTVFAGSFAHTPVACKKLGDAGKQALFLAELAKLQRADHPRVVRLFGVVVLGGEHIAVMELCGSNRAALLPIMGHVKSDMPEYFSLNQVLGWCLSVAHGMRSLHDKNIIHRDLAPRNIVVGPRAADALQVWLGDHNAPLPDDLDLKVDVFV
jgi:serine/threonine protein kinase